MTRGGQVGGARSPLLAPARARGVLDRDDEAPEESWATSTEPAWLTDPHSPGASVLAELVAEDARHDRGPLREPDPGPWDDEAAPHSASLDDALPNAAAPEGARWEGSGAARRGDQVGWRRVGMAGDLASAAHVPLATGGQSPHALLDVAAADPGDLHPGELVDALAAAEQLKAWADAQQLSALSALSDWCATLRGVGNRFDQVPVEVMAGAEAGPALGISPRAAALRVGLARDLRRLPATHGALRAGVITLPKARAISEALAPLDDTDAAAVETRVLASHASATLPALSQALRRAVIAIDPAAAEDRHRRAVKTRGVWRQALEDGLARLEWLAPADQIETAHAVLTDLARAAQASDRHAARTARRHGQPEPDVRTLDQARSDVLADLTAGQLADLVRSRRATDHGDQARHPSEPADEAHHPSEPADEGRHPAAPGDQPSRDAGRERPTQRGPNRDGHNPTDQRPSADSAPGVRPRPQVDVVVDLATLLGLNDLPGELVGHGPIPASIARQLAADGAWRTILTDQTGRVLDYSSRAHDPPADLAAFLRVRDRTCRFPGCRMPAVRCDLDHNVPHPDGDTSAGNLCCLCRSHHRIKTLTDTRLVNDGRGTMTWTMPSGKRWTTHPPPPLIDPPAATPGSVCDTDDSVHAAYDTSAGPSAPRGARTGDPMIDDPPPF